MPTWHFRERHQRSTDAAPHSLLAAAEQLTWADVPVLRALMRVRTAGRVPHHPDQRILDGMSGIGFAVLHRSGDELVIGAVGRPWRPGGAGAPPLLALDEPAATFTEFDAPGWAKMIANFRVVDGELSTETRVLLTDDRSRRAFGRYWLLIHPFSALIRRRWLAAIARRASRSP
jgi:hypothetical protein